MQLGMQLGMQLVCNWYATGKRYATGKKAELAWYSLKSDPRLTNMLIPMSSAYL